ncbi:ascorbate-specific PTS system [Vibrio sp. JCM 19236]|nr:ascorbate-specific PTS system [Vibrio sp. JCM 19236]
MQGLSVSSMFFFVVVALAGVYMYFASAKLRAEEDAEKAATMTAVTPEGFEVEVKAEREATQVTSGQAVEQKPVRILVCCGSGQGSSMMCSKKIKSYLDKQGIPSTTSNCAITDHKSRVDSFDIIVTSVALAEQVIELPEGKFKLGVKNMIMPKTFADDLVSIIKNNFHK